jgi:hypothetical protein
VHSIYANSDWVDAWRNIALLQRSCSQACCTDIPHPAQEWDAILNTTWNSSLPVNHCSLWDKSMDSLAKLSPSGLFYLYRSTKHNPLFRLRDSGLC